ncbi:TPA: hypothetical protein ENS27_20140 [bacterium]|nr:hypothetical protein [bacterium]
MKKLSIVFAVFLISIQSAFGLFYDFEKASQADDWKIFAGKGYIEKGKYIIEKTDATDAIAVVGDMTWTDCVVTCKATMLEGSADNIGLVWRLADGKMFYVISVRMDQRVGYCGCINGAWMNGGAPINPIDFKTKIGVEYKFKLVIQGKKFQFFLDGEDMGVWEDNQLATGMVGVRVWNAKMAVDDFDINGPGIKPSAVDSKDKLAVAWGNIKM